MNENKVIGYSSLFTWIIVVICCIAVIIFSLTDDPFEKKILDTTAHQAVVTVNENTGKVALILYDAANDEEIIYWMDYQRTDLSGVKYYYFD